MDAPVNLVQTILAELYDGSTTRMAAAIGGKVKRQNIEHWLASGRIPWEHCSAIERLSSGHFPCEVVRSDLTWSRIPDKAWPWHAKGRPVIEASKVAA